MRALSLLLAFGLSGASSLIYQVVWVRELGLVFGNTIHSASMVTSLFMLGLGVGGLIAGRYADGGRGGRRLLGAYTLLELGIAAAGCALAFSFPVLVDLAASVSAYSHEGGQLYSLSTGTLVARYLTSALIVGPICVAMGASLPLVVRAISGADERLAGRAVAWLYAANTLGAAIGCFLVDHWLVPAWGARSTQLIAVGLGLAAAAAAWQGRASLKGREEPVAPAPEQQSAPQPGLRLTVSLVLFCSGFAALGLEIVWFRVLGYALGSDRTAFSLALTVVLVGLFLGALVASRVSHGRAPAALAVCIALGSASTLGSLALFDLDQLYALNIRGGLPFALILCLVPATCFGASFPLANKWMQDNAAQIGRRVATLYAFHTAGNVLGAVAAGFVLIPVFGVHLAAVDLALIALVSVVVLLLQSKRSAAPLGRAAWASAALGFVVLAAASQQDQWSLVERAMGDRSALQKKFIHVEEGPHDLVIVAENEFGRRFLYTNGHPMSGTSELSHRYMRGMAHLPLLLHDAPKRALIICFGVGNTTHAVSQHAGLTEIDVADLSREVLAQAHHFASTNRNVLKDPRVRVFVGDGRHHLVMSEPERYDLITLEPPPVTFAGMGALYSKEFYALARERLTEGGYMTQWLPVYQTQHEATAAMVAAFVEVFDNAVILLGYRRELILMGRKGGAITFDPAQLSRRLSESPGVPEALEAIQLGELHELLGMYVGGPEALARASEGVEPLSDDRPLNEYRVRTRGPTQIPGALFDPTSLRDHCPNCWPKASDEGARLDRYLATFAELLKSNAFLRAPDHPLQPSENLGFPAPDVDAAYLSTERFLLQTFASPEALRLRATRLQESDPKEAIALLTKVVFLEKSARALGELSEAYARVGDSGRAAFFADQAARATNP